MFSINEGSNKWVHNNRSVGKVIDEKHESYYVLWIDPDRVRLSVVCRDRVQPYPVEDELNDLKLLKKIATQFEDDSWGDDLDVRYMLLLDLLDQKEVYFCIK